MMLRTVGILMVAAVAGGAYAYTRHHEPRPGAIAAVAAPAPTVKTAKAEAYCLPVYVRGS